MRGFVLYVAAALAASPMAGCRSTEAVRTGLGIDDASGPGRVRQVFPAAMDEVHRATVEAMGDLNIRVVQEADYAFDLADGESWGRTDPADAGRGTRKVPRTAAGGSINFADSTFTASDGRVVRLREIACTTRGTLGDGRAVTVVARRQGRAATAVAVRVGRFGDSPLSSALLERLGVRLGTLPPAPVPAGPPPSSPNSNPYFSRGGPMPAEILRERADAGYRDLTGN